MEKVYNIVLMFILALVVCLSHLDRTSFITELRESRETYVRAINNIEIIKEDIAEIKTVLKGGEL